MFKRLKNFPKSQFHTFQRYLLRETIDINMTKWNIVEKSISRSLINPFATHYFFKKVIFFAPPNVFFSTYFLYFLMLNPFDSKSTAKASKSAILKITIFTKKWRLKASGVFKRLKNFPKSQFHTFQRYLLRETIDINMTKWNIVEKSISRSLINPFATHYFFKKVIFFRKKFWFCKLRGGVSTKSKRHLTHFSAPIFSIF